MHRYIYNQYSHVKVTTTKKNSTTMTKKITHTHAYQPNHNTEMFV